MVINQFHAIGDILFCEPIFRYYHKKNGEKPIVPVRDHLMWLASYIESADFRPMSTFQLDYDSMAITNPDYLPLRFANQILRGLAPDDHSDFENCMLDKYRLVAFIEGCGDEVHVAQNSLDHLLTQSYWPRMIKDLSHEVDRIMNGSLPKWTDIKLNFNWNKGQHLMELHKTLFMEHEYTLVNNYCQAGEIDIKNTGSLPVHKMTEVPGYTVLDWCSMMCNAHTFESVSTSTFFVMQALCNELSAQELPLMIVHPRPNEDGLRGVSKLIEQATFRVMSVDEHFVSRA